MAISRTLKSKKVKSGDTSSKAKSDILKPFQCQDCDATFGRKADCQRHWNTKHDPDRKSRELVCPWVGCDKTFSQKSNFEDHYKTHMPRHLTQRPCPFSKACPFLWVTRSALSKHKKESHGKNAVKVVRSTNAQSLHGSETPEFIPPAPSPSPSTSTSSDRPLSQSVSMRPLLPRPRKLESLPLAVISHSHSHSSSAPGYSPTAPQSPASYASYSPVSSQYPAPIHTHLCPHHPVCSTTSGPNSNAYQAEPTSAPPHITRFPYLPPPHSQYHHGTYPQYLAPHPHASYPPTSASHRESSTVNAHTQVLPSPRQLLAMHDRSSSSERYNYHHYSHSHSHHHPYNISSPLSPLGLIHRSSAPHLRGTTSSARFTASQVNETRRLPPPPAAPISNAIVPAGAVRVKLEDDYEEVSLDRSAGLSGPGRSYSPTFSFERERRHSGAGRQSQPQSRFQYNYDPDHHRPSSSHTLSSTTSTYSYSYGLGNGARTADTARTSISPAPAMAQTSGVAPRSGMGARINAGGPPRSVSPSVNSDYCNDRDRDHDMEMDMRPRSAGGLVGHRYRGHELDEGLGRRPSSSGNIPTGTRYAALKAQGEVGSSRGERGGVCRSWSEIVLGPSPGAKSSVVGGNQGQESEAGSDTEHGCGPIVRAESALPESDSDTDAGIKKTTNDEEEGGEGEDNGDMEY